MKLRPELTTSDSFRTLALSSLHPTARHLATIEVVGLTYKWQETYRTAGNKPHFGPLSRIRVRLESMHAMGPTNSLRCQGRRWRVREKYAERREPYQVSTPITALDWQVRRAGSALVFEPCPPTTSAMKRRRLQNGVGGLLLLDSTRLHVPRSGKAKLRQGCEPCDAVRTPLRANSFVGRARARSPC